MVKRILIIFLTIIITATTLCSCVPQVKMVPYDQMEYVEYNTEKASEIAEEISNAVNQNRPRKLLSCYKKAVRELNRIQTYYSMSDINYSNDTSNEYWIKRVEIDQVLLNDANEILCSALADALHSSSGKELYKVMTPGEINQIEGSNDNQQQLDLMKKEAEVIGEYLSTEKTDERADCYLKLVKIRNELARISSYESYDEYAYECIYMRAFSPSEIESLCETTRKYLAPVVIEIDAKGSKISEPEYSVADTRKMLETCDAGLEQYMPELGNMVDYILKYRLYTPHYDENCADRGFMTTLPYYKSAYLYNYPTGSSVDLYYNFHELGHFSNGIKAPSKGIGSLLSIDIAEIQSTALENIMDAAMYDIFDQEEADQAIYNHLCTGALSMLDGCILHEFEQYAYSHEDASIEELNHEFKRINESYGINWISETYWTQIFHIFSMPFYYVSYSTAGLAATGLAADYRQNPAQARERYMKVLMTEEYDGSFKDFCNEYELLYFGNEKDVIQAAKYIKEYAEELLPISCYTDTFKTSISLRFSFDLYCCKPDSISVLQQFQVPL